jgi:hypothetical protein
MENAMETAAEATAMSATRRTKTKKRERSSATETQDAPAVKVSFINPVCAPTDGGTKLILHGSGFEDGDTEVVLRLRGGSDLDLDVASIVQSELKIACIVPALPKHLLRDLPVFADVVVVTSRGRTITPTCPVFRYYLQPAVTKISPSCAPTNGRYSITVHLAAEMWGKCGSAQWLKRSRLVSHVAPNKCAAP